MKPNPLIKVDNNFFNYDPESSVKYTLVRGLDYDKLKLKRVEIYKTYLHITTLDGEKLLGKFNNDKDAEAFMHKHYQDYMKPIITYSVKPPDRNEHYTDWGLWSGYLPGRDDSYRWREWNESNKVYYGDNDSCNEIGEAATIEEAEAIVNKHYQRIWKRWLNENLIIDVQWKTK